jgi:hypothetical protein
MTIVLMNVAKSELTCSTPTLAKIADAALLDGNLNGQRVDESASTLKRHDVPFVFISGYGRESLPAGFREVALLNKPFSRVQLLEGVKRLIARGGDRNPLPN